MCYRTSSSELGCSTQKPIEYFPDNIQIVDNIDYSKICEHPDKNIFGILSLNGKEYVMCEAADLVKRKMGKCVFFLRIAKEEKICVCILCRFKIRHGEIQFLDEECYNKEGIIAWKEPRKPDNIKISLKSAIGYTSCLGITYPELLTNVKREAF